MAATNNCTVIYNGVMRRIASPMGFTIQSGTAAFNGTDVSDFLDTDLTRVESVQLTPIDAQGGEVISWADGATLNPGVPFVLAGTNGLTISRTQGSTWNNTSLLNVPNTPTAGLRFSYLIIGTA